MDRAVDDAEMVVVRDQYDPFGVRLRAWNTAPTFVA